MWMRSEIPKYIVIPYYMTHDWIDILNYAEDAWGITGNAFIGSRQYNSPSGNIVFKLCI